MHRALGILGIALVASLNACSGANDGNEDSTGEDSDEGALTLAQDDFTTLSAELEKQIAHRKELNNGGSKTSSIKPMNTGGGSPANVCDALGSGAHSGRELPNFFAFAGGDATVAAIVGASVAVESTWDLTHRQLAVFDGREVSVGGSAGVSAGVYAGLGMIDLSVLKKIGEEAPENIVAGWSGSYFGASIDIEVPFKFVWANGGCITDKVGAFFACELGGGVGVATDILPLNGELVKGTVTPSDFKTRKLGRSIFAPHSEGTGEFDKKSYAYIQFAPLEVPVISSPRNANARAALAMTSSMPLALAVAAGPLALALGVDADLRANRGVGLAKTCASKK